MPGESSISNTRLETELHFECLWYEDAWAELEEWAKTAVEAAKEYSERHNHRSWEFINRLLVHAARIQRLVNPVRSDRESKHSWEERERFASEMARRINPSLLNRKDLGRARNITEHANEYLADFEMQHRGEEISAFSIEWGEAPVIEEKPGYAFRSYRHASGECRVFGRPVNLRSTLGIIREIRLRTHAHVFTRLFEPFPIPQIDTWKLSPIQTSKGDTSPGSEGFG